MARAPLRAFPLAAALAAVMAAGPAATARAEMSKDKAPAGPMAKDKAPAGAVSKDKAAIEISWNRYQDYVATRKGTAAVALVAAPTIKYYGDVRQAVLTATRAQVARLGILTRLSVYMVRHMITAKRLQGMSARQFLAWTIDKGMTAGGPQRRIKLTGVTVKNDTGYGYAGAAGATAPAFRFLREDGVWKIDFVGIIRKFEPMMDQRMKQAKITDERLLKLMVRRHSDKPVDFARLQQPLVKP